MTDPLFVSQQLLETWIERGEVTFDGTILTLLAQKTSYRLESAAKILSVLDGVDKDGWVGKILPVSEIAAAGAEHMADSVIKGDTAYQCEEGFIGKEPVGTAKAPAAPIAKAPAPPPASVPAAKPAPGVPPKVAPLAPPLPGPGKPSPTGAAPAAPKAPLPPPPAPALVQQAQAQAAQAQEKGPEPTADDMQLLTDFLLKNL